MMGWFSSSKYSILGGLRAVAQRVSYEVSLVLIFLCIIRIVKQYSFMVFFKISDNKYFYFSKNYFIHFFIYFFCSRNKSNSFWFFRGRIRASLRI
jgi:NADH-quinone oxidoreductase subunit H